MELSRFGGDDQRPPMAPGPLLAGVAYAVAGSDGAGLAGVSEDFLFAVISGGRRMASWATWLEFSAMRELALRHPAVPARPARKTRPVTPEPAEGRTQTAAPQHPPAKPAARSRPVSLRVAAKRPDPVPPSPARLSPDPLSPVPRRVSLPMTGGCSSRSSWPTRSLLTCG